MDIKNLKGYLGWGSVFLLSMVPLLLWFFQGPIMGRFSSPGLFATSLGQIAGLTGMAMFSLVIILSARLKVFERIFWGINESYVIHHMFGGIAFSLLLFHPILLAYTFVLISFRQGALFLLPSLYWPTNFGMIALLIMVVVLVITFYFKTVLKYQNWKFMHQFMGLSFIIAMFHIFLIGSDIAINPPLKIYMAVLVFLGLAAVIYRTILGAFVIKRYGYKVEKITPLQDSTNEVRLVSTGPEMNFFSGQFVFITLGGKNVPRETHPFTVSSAPGQGVRLSIKESGDWTRKIKNSEAGDLAQIEGPYGKFNFRNYGPPAGGKKQIWIAGGIGVTPFLSMARDLKETDKNYEIDFYYSAKTESGFIFKEELEQIAERNKNLKIFFWVTDEDGFITAEKIGRRTANYKNSDILVCGPYAMMSALKTQFLKAGFKKGRLHTEDFQL